MRRLVYAALLALTVGSIGCTDRLKGTGTAPSVVPLVEPGGGTLHPMMGEGQFGGDG